MKNNLIPRILLSLVAIFFLCSISSAEVLKIVVNDTIQPITEEYIARAIDEAQRRNDQAVLIEINTPGGLVESTRHIIEKITSSQVPVILYVAPSGSRAGSAGIFILEAADIAAMAPGTNAGAAHPVLLSGGVFLGSLARVSVQSVVFFALLHVLHVVSPFASDSLLCCSFPLSNIVVLFAARYKAAEAESASMLLISTLLLAVTVPAILWLSR